MPHVTREIASEFCKLCEWAYESWVNHKMLFDENTDCAQNINKARPFTERLSKITQEYCLLQICKLHDRTEMNGSTNLTINYIVRYGDWGNEMPRIEGLQNKLNELGQHLKTARNKALAHNDLISLMSGSVLGTFPKDRDNEYFEALQDLVDAVHYKWYGRPFPFNDFVKGDVKEFLTLLEKV